MICGVSLIVFLPYKENKLRKGIDIQVRYSPVDCEIYFPVNGIRLSKEKINMILSEAPSGLNKVEILNGLIQRGYELEDINMDAAKAELAQRKIFITIENKTHKVLKRVNYDIRVQRSGYSSDIAPYSYKNRISDKILKPGEKTDICIDLDLKDDPKNLEFFSEDIYPDFY